MSGDIDDFRGLLAKVGNGETLSISQAERAFDIMTSGDATPAQMGGFLMALKVRGETAQELAGGARALRAKMHAVKAPPGAIDIVGTGGDHHGTYNVSSCSAFVVAGAGVPVAKHGNRAFTSKSGAADVLAALGINLDLPIETLEKAIANGRAVCGGITGWENRWYQRGMLDAAPDGISARGQATLKRAEAMTPDDYRTGLLARQQAQLAHMAVASLADAAITLACPGPAPLWSGDVAGQPLAPRPTGDFVFNAPSSMLFAPVVTVPLMSVGGMPVGVQLMGQQHEDARMAGLARWFSANLKRVVTQG